MIVSLIGLVLEFKTLSLLINLQKSLLDEELNLLHISADLVLFEILNTAL